MIANLVQGNRVHGSVYTDPAIFAAEQKTLFSLSWLYVGHTSQIPNAGSYLTVSLAGQSMLVIRQAEGSVRIFNNRCTHKGMQLVPHGATGQAPALRCGYHGWVFGNDGCLRTRPGEAGFQAGGLGKQDAAANLNPLPCVDSYRGFIFARLVATGPSLHDWLGSMRASLDNFIDRAPESEIEVAGPPLSYLHHCNWKFFAENTLDALHPMVVHHSAVRPAELMQKEARAQQAAIDGVFDLLIPFGSPISFFDSAGQRVAPFGHGELGINSSIHAGYGVDPGYWAAMTAAYGETRAKAILDYSPNNSLLYPSVMFKSPVSLLRVIEPVSVDQTILHSWHFRLKGAPASLLERTIAYSTIVNSPAGPVGPDDHEAYMRLQQSLSSENAWVQMGRYSADQPADAMSPGTSDLVFRNQFSAWRDYLAMAS